MNHSLKLPIIVYVILNDTVGVIALCPSLDCCSGSRGGGGGGDVGGGGERARSALHDDNDDDDAEADGLYNVRSAQRRAPSRFSLDDALSEQSDTAVFTDPARHGDVMSGRGGAVIAPATIPGASHPARPYGTSSISSGTGTCQRQCQCQ